MGKQLWVLFIWWWCTDLKNHSSQIKNNSLASMFPLIVTTLFQKWNLWLWTIYMWNRYKIYKLIELRQNIKSTIYITMMYWSKNCSSQIKNDALTSLFDFIIPKLPQNEACDFELSKYNKYKIISINKTKYIYYEYNLYNDDVIIKKTVE